MRHGVTPQQMAEQRDKVNGAIAGWMSLAGDAGTAPWERFR
jgi:hypothetical protein